MKNSKAPTGKTSADVIEVDFVKRKRTRYHTIEERIRGYTGPAEGRYGCMFWTGGLWKCDGYPMMTGSHGKQGRAGRVIMATKPGRELKPTELVLHKPDVC